MAYYAIKLKNCILVIKKNTMIKNFENFIFESVKVWDIYFNEGSGQYDNKIGFKGSLKDAQEFAKKEIMTKYKSGETSGKTIWASFYDQKTDEEDFDTRIKFDSSKGKFL